MAKMLSNFVTFLCKKHRFALIIKVHFELNTLLFSLLFQTKATNIYKDNKLCFCYPCMFSCRHRTGPLAGLRGWSRRR